MARPSWQGYLKLSLVSCPVALYNVVSASGEVHFHLINPKTGNRVRNLTVDASTEKPVERSELVKGFEVSKNKFITLTPKEIDAVRLESNKTISIEKFVPAEDIDRLYWDNPYVLAPKGKEAAEPFAVIRAAMEKAGKVALARLVMAQRERLVAIEARGAGLIATTLRAHDEVRDPNEFFADIPKRRPDAEMIQIATKIIEQKSAGFDPSKFDDRYEDALKELIAQKKKGKKIEAPAPPATTSKTSDIMEALRASLKESGAGGPRRSRSKPTARRTRPKPAAVRKRARR